MSETNSPSTPAKPPISDLLKNWTMMIVTLIFVVLYVLNLVKVIPLPEGARDLQAIVFVIIGYYFGRVPAEKTENTLKDEISRQAIRADAAASTKDMAARERDTLEERVKNARSVLEAARTATGAESSGKSPNPRAVETAINVLRS